MQSTDVDGANTMANRNMPEGFGVPYGRDSASRCYGLAFVSAALFIGFIASGSRIALALGVAAAMGAYYFLPLINAKRPRLGANQYGVFVDGFGIIDWRAISEMRIQTTAIRSIEQRELQIQLSRDLNRALMADWRRLPYWRLLMRLPWTMTPDNMLRIDMTPFATEPDTVLEQLNRMRRFYG